LRGFAEKEREANYRKMEDLTKPRAAVHQIVSRLETRFRNFNISEIVKAGSLGHGTVVPGHYDIDLVLYSRDITAEVVLLYNGFGNWTSQLKEFIEREFGITSYTPGYNNRSVQFKCSYQGVNLSVDLLVSPFWSNPREFYQFLESLSRERRDIFTVCASKWQIEFFKRVDSQAKEYIRRAKAWRNKYFGADKLGRPSSYLMSLLVVKAYETANRRYYGAAGPREVTTELMSLVKTPLLDVYWEDFYKLAEYSNLLPALPRVVDPANPANNVWEGGIRGDASVLVSIIHTIDLSQVNY
jgi:hypothetical protein